MGDFDLDSRVLQHKSLSDQKLPRLEELIRPLVWVGNSTTTVEALQ